MARPTAVIHVNRARIHQKAAAKVLQAGFEWAGVYVEITDVRQPVYRADINIVMGPHYALRDHLANREKLDRVLMLDRCYWGNPQTTVSLHWLDQAGCKQWPDDAPGDRSKPNLQPWRESEKRALCIEDYGKTIPAAAIQPFFNQVEVRQHPAGRDKQRVEPLGTVLERNDVAVGYSSTALVEAAITGLPVICFADPGTSPVSQIASTTPAEVIRPDREQWLNNLSYCNWTYEEISSGAAAEYLLCQ